MQQRIAIVGSGISGLSALWALKQTNHEVHLFEAQDYFGGHTKTFKWANTYGDGSTAVDPIFTLFNESSYPNFVSFLSHLNIAPSSPKRVSFGVSGDDGRSGWSSETLASIFGSLSNLCNFNLWRMLFDIWRFHLLSVEVLEPKYRTGEESVGAYLRRNGYGSWFQDNYLIPLISSLWVHDPDQTLNSIPIRMLVAYMQKHQLLRTFSTPKWRHVEGGASRYVDAILQDIPKERLHKSTAVRSVWSEGSNLILQLERGSQERFNKVILACPAPHALKILGEKATKEEKNILKHFKTGQSTIYLHSDRSFLPRDARVRAAWNYHNPTSRNSPSLRRVSVTANYSAITGADTPGTELILMTMNPYRLPEESLTKGCVHFEHLLLDLGTPAAQEAVGTLQGQRNIWFAGAWLGLGFHEDGFTKGVDAAKMACPEIEIPFALVHSQSQPGEGMLNIASLGVPIVRTFVSLMRMVPSVPAWISFIHSTFMLALKSNQD